MKNLLPGISSYCIQVNSAKYWREQSLTKCHVIVLPKSEFIKSTLLEVEHIELEYYQHAENWSFQLPDPKPAHEN